MNKLGHARLVMLLLIVTAGGCRRASTSAVSIEPGEVLADPYGIDVHSLQDQVKEELNDPDSAVFRRSTLYRDEGTSSEAAGAGNYTLFGEVNAKNRMGGYSGFTRFISSGAFDKAGVLHTFHGSNKMFHTTYIERADVRPYDRVFKAALGYCAGAVIRKEPDVH